MTAGATLAWAELLRGPAILTVPGDTLAGAAAGRPGAGRGGGGARSTVLAAASSVCLYWSGMALNDWADRAVDAEERPGRPLPSGRIRPAAALGAAAGLTAAGLGLAAACSRPALLTAGTLAATVWAYDLVAKNTPLGPPTMAAARALDLLLGAAACDGGPAVRRALPAAGLLGAHTLAVTTVSGDEVHGGDARPSLAALAVTAAVAFTSTRAAPRGSAFSRARAAPSDPGSAGPVSTPGAVWRRRPAWATAVPGSVTAAAAAVYGATFGPPLLAAALDPTGPRTRRAVAAGIHAMLPLQAALAARSGAARTAVGLLALLPAVRRLSRKVTPT